jgi:hypothetical protein
MGGFSIGGFRVPLPDFDGPDRPAASVAPEATPAPQPAAPPAATPLPPARPGMHAPVEAGHVPIDRKIPESALAAVKEFDRSLNPAGRSAFREPEAWQAKNGSWIVTIKTRVGGDFIRGPVYGDVAMYRFKDGVMKPLGEAEQQALKAEYDRRSNQDSLESGKAALAKLGSDVLGIIANPPPRRQSSGPLFDVPPDLGGRP